MLAAMSLAFSSEDFSYAADGSRWDGNYYANHSKWQFLLATKALSYVQIPADAKVLDVGCRDGRFTKYLASLIPEG